MTFSIPFIGEKMNERCLFPANQDLYGIGVRVGLYCQWVATLMATEALPEEADALRSNNICFQIAIMVSMVVLTSKRSIIQPEIMIALPLCFGGFSAATYPVVSHAATRATDHVQQSIFQDLLAIQTFGALTAYSCWFWWHGMADMSACPCVYYVFIFYKVEIEKLRIFGIIMSIIGCLVFLFVNAMYITRVISILRDRLSTSFQWFASTQTYAPSLGPRWHRWLTLFISAISMVYLAIMVEMTIAWNEITGSYSVDSHGQLVPLIIGVSALVKVCFLQFRRKMQNARNG